MWLPYHGRGGLSLHWARNSEWDRCGWNAPDVAVYFGWRGLCYGAAVPLAHRATNKKAWQVLRKSADWQAALAGSRPAPPKAIRQRQKSSAGAHVDLAPKSVEGNVYVPG